MKKKTFNRISKSDIDGVTLWGCRPSPEGHLAFIGFRACDRPDREFTLFSNRMTRIGDDHLLDLIGNFMSRKGFKIAKQETKFETGISDEIVVSGPHRISQKSRYAVSLEMRTAGEYLYASCYLDELDKSSV